ncbi:MAG: helix-turn-helix transcriptional regulator [Jatrophihabitans sp.]
MARKLVGTGELVRMLGLSRSRVGHLIAQPGFPRPYDELIMGKVWRIKDVENWAIDHGRALNPLDAAEQT